MNNPLDHDCLCGVCPPCRRADREYTKVTARPPEQLSARARAILDDVEHPDPFDKTRTGKPRQPKPKPSGPKRQARNQAWWDAYNAARRKGVEPIECVECGQFRALAKIGRAFKVSGGDDRCEVCYDRARFAARLARHEDGVDPLHRQERIRLLRGLDRVLKDGRAYHPEAEHGTLLGYGSYGCRCELCITAKTTAKAARSTARTKGTPTT